METRRCPTCGAPLTVEQAEAGSCMACMLELGLAAGETAVPVGSASAARAAPESIGPYRVLGTLGEGGMGIVYLAQQDQLVRRRVALKVIKRGMSTTEVIRRFEAERQALARMDHPSIARVHDAGETDDGQPYFAMEYVEGEPITTHCDRRRMTMRERLSLLIEVCAGVQHAHHKGVIHRDIKPSNVLVATVGDGSGPLPKIIDFGVAKAIEQRLTERSLFTELGMIVGTPEYMSPEQAEFTGERVDTRTDVYALGVLQYELLTGSLPFDPAALRAGGFEHICRRVREEEPAKPSTKVSSLGEAAAGSAHSRCTDLRTLRRELSGDLDWITMKALAKDPERRYGSPQELADDIRRYLDNQPVSAGPPSAAYRIKKFVRRNRMAVTSLLSIVTVLVAGAVAATTFAVREASQRRAAERARADLEKVVRFQQDMIADVDLERAGAGLLADLKRRLADSGPDPRLEACFERGLLRINGPDAALRLIDDAFLDRAGGVLDREFRDQPLLEARLRRTLAGTYRELGLHRRAEPHALRAVELHRDRLGERHPETLRSVSELAFIYLRQGRDDEAESLLVENLASLRDELGPDDAETLSALNDLGLLYFQQGRFDEAESRFTEAYRARGRILGPDHPDTLITLGNLGLVYWRQGRLEQAEETLRRTVAAGRRVQPHGSTLMMNVRDLANVSSQLGRYEEAERLYREALEAQERMLGRDHMDTLTTKQNLAVLYDRQGRDEAAEALYRENLEAQVRTLGEDHINTLVSKLNLSAFLLERDRLAEAEPIASEVVEKLSRLRGAEDFFTLGARANLAEIHARRGDGLAALRESRAVVEAGRRALPPDHPMLPQLEGSFAGVQARLGLLDEADATYRRAADHPAAIAEIKDAYARFLLERNPEKALRYALDANEMTDYQAAELIETLVAVQRKLGRTDEAIEACRHAIRALPPQHPRREEFERTLRELRSGSGGSTPAP